MPRFRAAYDFLLLRAESGDEELQELAQWWTDFQAVDEESRATLSRDAPAGESGGKKRRRRRRRKKPAGSE